MAALHLLPVPTRFVPLLVSMSGAALLVVGVILVGKIARRIAPEAPAVATIAMWATALYYPLIFWTLRGLEPGLLSVLIEASVLLAWSLRDVPTTAPGGRSGARPRRRRAHPHRLRAAGGWGARLARVAGREPGRPDAPRSSSGLRWRSRSARTPSSSSRTTAMRCRTRTRSSSEGSGSGRASLGQRGVGRAGARRARRRAGAGRGRARCRHACRGTRRVAGVALRDQRPPTPSSSAATRGSTSSTPTAISRRSSRCSSSSPPAAVGRSSSWDTGASPPGAARTGRSSRSSQRSGTRRCRPDVAGFDLRNDFNIGRLAHAHWMVFAVGGRVAPCLPPARRSAAGPGSRWRLLAGVLIAFVTLPAWTDMEARRRPPGHRQQVRDPDRDRAARRRAREADDRGRCRGAIPYWSTLPAVDLLGKSDAVIAVGAEPPPGLHPRPHEVGLPLQHLHAAPGSRHPAVRAGRGRPAAHLELRLPADLGQLLPQERVEGVRSAGSGEADLRDALTDDFQPRRHQRPAAPISPDLAAVAVRHRWILLLASRCW